MEKACILLALVRAGGSTAPGRAHENALLGQCLLRGACARRAQTTATGRAGSRQGGRAIRPAGRGWAFPADLCPDAALTVPRLPRAAAWYGRCKAPLCVNARNTEWSGFVGERELTPSAAAGGYGDIHRSALLTALMALTQHTAHLSPGWTLKVMSRNRTSPRGVRQVRNRTPTSLRYSTSPLYRPRDSLSLSRVMYI